MGTVHSREEGHDNNRCSTCRRALRHDRLHLQLNENAVAVAGCPQCRPRAITVFYVSQEPRDPPPAYQEPNGQQVPENTPRRRRPANNGENRCSGNNFPQTLILDLDNISRVQNGNRIELYSDECWKRYEVINHSIEHKTIEMLEEFGEKKRYPFTHQNIVGLRGRVCFRYESEKEQWDDRIQTPQYLPRETTMNEKLFWESVRLKYFETVIFMRTSLRFLADLTKRAWTIGANLMKRSAEVLKDTAIAPVQSFLYWNWKNQDIEDRFQRGEITEEERRTEVEYYKAALRKTGAIGGAVGGAVAAAGIRATLMSSYGVGSAVAAVEAMCVSYPALAPVVAAVGGPATFVAIGGLALVAGGGIAGFVLIKKLSSD